VFVLLYSFVVDSSRMQEAFVRMGAGLLLGGLIVYGLHRALISRMTDSATRPNVTRIFKGLNLVLCGLIGMAALIAVCVMITQEEIPEEPFKLAGILMVVYLAAWGSQARALSGMMAAAKT
jgi:drug/metabolite transporter (DMT)-like permease